MAGVDTFADESLLSKEMRVFSFQIFVRRMFQLHSAKLKVEIGTILIMFLHFHLHTD